MIHVITFIVSVTAFICAALGVLALGAIGWRSR